MSIDKVVFCFAPPAANHWVPRFVQQGIVAQVGEVVPIDDRGFAQLPPSIGGTVYVVNAAVAAAYRKVGGYRSDIFCLPVGAPQDDSDIDLDFLVKV